MARQKGMLNLSGNLEPLAGAPLDSRDITPTVADLYIASNWPYKYIGMKTTVTATGDTYRLVNLDVTQESSWVKEGSGGSGASNLSDLEDVDLINPEEGEALIYDGEGGWTNGPAGQTYSDFTGATSQDAGAHGLVPAPTTADVDKYLKGDGSWGAIEMPNFDYSNEFGAENILSLTEKMIGQWTDGKPLYQKTVNCGALPNNNDKNVPHGISNLDTIYYIQGIAVNNGVSIPLVFAWKDNINSVASNYVDGNNIVLGAGIDRSAFTAYVTLRYTKTTDSAMSIGAPNDYSTTEKIVGTWIDGKPLYQKTISGLSINTIWNSQMFAYANVSPLVNDVDNVIDSCGLGIEPNSNKKAYISSIDIQVKTDEWQLQIVNNYVINTITLKYTKTS